MSKLASAKLILMRNGDLYICEEIGFDYRWVTCMNKIDTRKRGAWEALPSQYGYLIYKN